MTYNKIDIPKQPGCEERVPSSVKVARDWLIKHFPHFYYRYSHYEFRHDTDYITTMCIPRGMDYEVLNKWIVPRERKAQKTRYPGTIIHPKHTLHFNYTSRKAGSGH